MSWKTLAFEDCLEKIKTPPKLQKSKYLSKGKFPVIAQEDSIINGYSLSRNLNNIEIESLNLVLRIAAIRILITRLHDFIFHPSDAIVLKKDPYQYLNILKWHQKNIVIIES